MIEPPEEDRELGLIRAVVRPTDRVVEAGTGVHGQVTALLVERCSLVVSVDPVGPAWHPSYADRDAQFLPVKAAIGIGGGETKFHRCQEWWGSVTPEWIDGRAKTRFAPTESVELVPVVDAVEMVQNHLATVLILDIEGSEFLILRYVARYIGKMPSLRSIVAELHPWHVAKDAAWIVEDAVLGAGFETRFCSRNPLNGNWHIHWERPG